MKTNKKRIELNWIELNWIKLYSMIGKSYNITLFGKIKIKIKKNYLIYNNIYINK